MTAYENLFKRWNRSATGYVAWGRVLDEEGYNAAEKDILVYTKELQKHAMRKDSLIAILKNDYKRFIPQYAGKQVVHHFRVRSRNGMYDLKRYLFVFDDKLEQVISCQDLDNIDDNIKKVAQKIILQDSIDYPFLVSSFAIFRDSIEYQ